MAKAKKKAAVKRARKRGKPHPLSLGPIKTAMKAFLDNVRTTGTRRKGVLAARDHVKLMLEDLPLCLEEEDCTKGDPGCGFLALPPK